MLSCVYNCYWSMVMVLSAVSATTQACKGEIPHICQTELLHVCNLSSATLAHNAAPSTTSNTPRHKI